MHLLRYCKRCNTKAYDEEGLQLFKKNRTCKHGRVNLCKKCNNKTSSKGLASSRYNITIEEYEKAMKTSDCCEICGSTNRLSYDHDHRTMEFRGVLCFGCNTGLGKLGDNEAGILKALAYLKRNRRDK